MRGGDEDQIFRRLDMGIFQLRLINGCIITYNKRLKKKKKKKCFMSDPTFYNNTSISNSNVLLNILMVPFVITSTS